MHKFSLIENENKTFNDQNQQKKLIQKYYKTKIILHHTTIILSPKLPPIFLFVL